MTISLLLAAAAFVVFVTQPADAHGQYRLETHYPPRYSFWRPSHIHILVDAPGFRRLVTRHYPGKVAKEGTFDLVLVPAKQGERKSGE